MYNILDYGEMMRDHGRIKAYSRALQQAVKPDSVVLDVGTGIGYFAMLACYFGARKVYALEINDSIELARHLASVNGYSDKIEFIQGKSLDVKLPEQVSVVISDLRGRLPLFQDHLPAILDIRRRFLKPGGVLIPAQDTLWGALVNSPDFYKRIMDHWIENNFGVNLKPVSEYAANNVVSRSQSPANEQIITAPKLWAKLDYHTFDNVNVRGDMNWTVTQNIVAHGIRLWFDTELAEDIGYSNAPDQELHVYGNYFLPWPEPISLSTGEVVSLKIAAKLVGDDYLWCWDTAISGNSSSNQGTKMFSQSTFKGQPFSLSRLKKSTVNYQPVLNKEGILYHQILTMMNAGIILEEIAYKIRELFPEKFSSFNQALDCVSQLSLKYSS